MAKKKEVNYFEMMEDAMRHACDISDRLLELIRDFGQEGTREELPQGLMRSMKSSMTATESMTRSSMS